MLEPHFCILSHGHLVGFLRDKGEETTWKPKVSYRTGGGTIGNHRDDVILLNKNTLSTSVTRSEATKEHIRSICNAFKTITSGVHGGGTPFF